MLSKSTTGKKKKIRFFTIKGESYDFGGVKSNPTWKKRLKKNSKKKSNQGAKWNKKMGGRSFVITCGAFKDTLLSRLGDIE